MLISGLLLLGHRMSTPLFGFPQGFSGFPAAPVNFPGYPANTSQAQPVMYAPPVRHRPTILLKSGIFLFWGPLFLQAVRAVRIHAAARMNSSLHTCMSYHGGRYAALYVSTVSTEYESLSPSKALGLLPPNPLCILL